MKTKAKKMKMVREGSEGGGGGEVVVVAVKLDAQGRELLTWSLLKLARPGDRLIALHVIKDCPHPLSSECGAVATGSLLSLVKAFDSLLAVYEGVCSLKQVDLKLKVCRASSVKGMVVREAKASGASKVVVGIGTSRKAMRSPTSKAKYCARKLPKTFSVFAVSNGKIIFQREASILQDRLKPETPQLQNHKSDNCCSDDKSLALVPIQETDVSCSNSPVVEGFWDSKHSWSLLRQAFLPKHHHSHKTLLKKPSLIKQAFRLPSMSSLPFVYPDQKQSVFSNDENHCSSTEREDDPPVACSTVSPCLGSDGFHQELKDLRDKYSSKCRLFSYAELASATSNFIPENMVGKGGSSFVYKGCLPDGKELAVKILKPSEDVLKEFVSEIEIITTLHHKNIISLFGFCYEDNKLLLVYDFLSRGSLEENIHGKKKDTNAFGWRERYKVAVGVAEALNYLHNISSQNVIHRDVKSSNILLSDDFEPQLSDFGLASWAATLSTQIICPNVAGTFGYLAPEYFMNGKMSDKVDVFAFGVVLLELLSGRMPINNGNPKGQESLVMWAKPILEDGKVSQLLDPHLGSDFNEGQIDSMVLAATLCIQRSPKFRPGISQVLKLLQGDEETKDWARHQVCTSKEVDTIDGEAFPADVQSYINLALLGLEDDSASISSSERVVSVEDYLQRRYSRASSFNS